MRILSEHDRVAIVTIAMITAVDIEKVARAYIAHMNELEDWIISQYYKKEEK